MNQNLELTIKIVLREAAFISLKSPPPQFDHLPIVKGTWLQTASRAASHGNSTQKINRRLPHTLTRRCPQLDRTMLINRRASNIVPPTQSTTSLLDSWDVAIQLNIFLLRHTGVISVTLLLLSLPPSPSPFPLGHNLISKCKILFKWGRKKKKKKGYLGVPKHHVGKHLIIKSQNNASQTGKNTFCAQNYTRSHSI